MTFPALLILTAYLISTATSILPRVSLWGSYERGQGLYVFAAYIAIFFLARETVRSADQRQRLLDAILLVSLPISMYAVLQHFGLDPVAFQTGGTSVTLRAISTLGNPIFLGAYLLMVIPVAVLRAYEVWQPADSRPNPGLAGLYGALLLLQLVAVFFARSRGPVLGLAGALGFGALVWAARRRARWMLAGMATILVLGLVLVGLSVVPGPGTTPLRRFAEQAGLTSRTARQRVLVWEGTVRLVTTEPARTWVGYGPDTLREVVGPHMPAEIAALKPDEDFDRAHNAILDLWASAGLLGVAAYLLVIGAVLHYGLRVLGLVPDAGGRRLFLGLALAGVLLGGLTSWLGIGRQWIGTGLPLGLLGGTGIFVMWSGLRIDQQRGSLSGDDLLVIALLSAAVGHVVETLVGIAIVATYTLFWIYAALIATLATNAREIRNPKSEIRNPKSEIQNPKFKIRNPKSEIRGWGLLTGTTLALFSFPLLTAGQARGGLAWGVTASITLLFGLLRLVLDRTDTDELILRYIGIAVGSVLAFLLVIWLPWPPLDVTHSTVGTFVYIVLALPALAIVLIVGTDHRFDQLKTLPGSLNWQLSWGRRLTYGALVIATFVLIWFSNVDPMRADVFYKEGLGLSVAGDYQNTARAMETSVALAPREDRYHSGVGAAYAQMAQAAKEPGLQAEWLSKAETHLQQAQQLDPYRADHLRNLGLLYRIWAQLGSSDQRETLYTRAVEFYARAAARSPVGVRIQMEWAGLFAQMGRWAEAAEHYQEALRLNRGFVEAHLGLGDAYVHLRDYAKAAQAYRGALTVDNTRALQTRQQAVQQHPDDPTAHQSLALLYAELGRTNAALAEAKAAQQLMGETDPAWDRFVTTLKENGR